MHLGAGRSHKNSLLIWTTLYTQINEFKSVVFWILTLFRSLSLKSVNKYTSDSLSRLDRWSRCVT